MIHRLRALSVFAGYLSPVCGSQIRQLIAANNPSALGIIIGWATTGTCICVITPKLGRHTHK